MLSVDLHERREIDPDQAPAVQRVLEAGSRARRGAASGAAPAPANADGRARHERAPRGTAPSGEPSHSPELSAALAPCTGSRSRSLLTLRRSSAPAGDDHSAAGDRSHLAAKGSGRKPRSEPASRELSEASCSKNQTARLVRALYLLLGWSAPATSSPSPRSVTRACTSRPPTGRSSSRAFARRTARRSRPRSRRRRTG